MISTLTFVMRPYWEKRLALSNEGVAQGMDLSRHALLEAQAATDQIDASLVVLIFPFKEQVYWPIVSVLVDDPAAYDITGLADEVKGWCEAHGIPYLDLTPVFVEHAASGEQLYFRYDAHWNEAGQGLAAWAIHQYLLEAGVIQ